MVADGKDPITRLRERGNDLHTRKEFTNAIVAYGQAIDLLREMKIPERDRAMLYSNRAGSLIETKQWDKAMVDAQQALKCDPTFLRVRS